ncbi:MAG: TetR/AcrR family transcriptional regulator, partial [Lactobacillus sp.]|nr:TetR/AcrR family transcriptional regulator [Lactobacillus sp.]
MTIEEKIINQTIHLIDTNGYQNLSLRKLTKELGLTTGAFY